MIGLDTNVLVRLFARDDPAMAERAERAIRQRCSLDQPGYINHLVLCELVSVLERTYGYERGHITALLDALCRAADFKVEQLEIVKEAIRCFRNGGASFTDCLVGAINRAARCEATLTFDQQGQIVGVR